jgi:hypothetical protein
VVQVAGLADSGLAIAGLLTVIDSGARVRFQSAHS